MSDLLKKAEADYRTAELLLSPVGNPTNDEYLTDLAAYHAQQAIEKVLNYVLEVLGVDYRKTHNIASVIALVESNGFVVSQELKSLAANVTMWEASGRYGDSPIAVKNDIEIVLGQYEDLRASVLSFLNKDSESGTLKKMSFF